MNRWVWPIFPVCDRFSGSSADSLQQRFRESTGPDGCPVVRPASSVLTTMLNNQFGFLNCCMSERVRHKGCCQLCCGWRSWSCGMLFLSWIPQLLHHESLLISFEFGSLITHSRELLAKPMRMPILQLDVLFSFLVIMCFPLVCRPVVLQLISYGIIT